MVNGAVNSFCVAAAVELTRGQRVNAVCPGVLVESMKDFGPYFRGYEPVAGARVALAYAKSVEGAQTGRIFRVE
jgi:NAD(P)-dependent dehydrogenase (short-subunit alcohol dehydrogenase family)